MFVSRRSVEEFARGIGGKPRPVRLRLPAPRLRQAGRDGARYGWGLRRPALGVEVRNSAMYLACVRPGLGRHAVAGTEVIADAISLNADQLRSRLRNFLSRCGAGDPVVILGLPRRDVIVRHLNLPAAAERALDEALQLQVALFKPNDDDEFCSDGTAVRDEGQYAATLALLPRTAVERTAEKFGQAGYAPARLTAVQLALLDLVLRVVPADCSSRLVVVHRRGSEAEIGMLRNRALVYSRAVQLSAEAAGGIGAAAAPDAAPATSDEPTRAGQQLLGATEQALASLRWTGQTPVLVVGTLAQETEQALARVGPLHHLRDWVAGADQVGKLWGAGTVRRAGRTGIVEGDDREGTKGQEFWGAIALALEGLAWLGQYRFNLLPTELRPRRQVWGYLPTYALLAANLLLLAAVGLRAPIERQILLKKYQTEINRLEAPAARSEVELERQKTLRQQLEQLRQFEAGGRQPLDLLSRVARQLPADAWLDFYNAQGERVEISGAAKSASTVLSALRALPQVQDVKFDGALTRDDSGMEHFRLQIRLKGSQ